MAITNPIICFSIPAPRQTGIWYLSGPTFVAGAYGPSIVSGYTLIGAADFNADGKPDYVLYGPSVQ